MRVALSREADADLDAILDYGIAMHGRAVAEDYVRTIDAAFDMLGDYPEIGMRRPEIEAGLRSFPTGVHQIFYFVFSDEISVVRVLHQAMDVAQHL